MKRVDLISPVRLRRSLRGGLIGRRLMHFDLVSSTQVLAKRMAERGEGEGLVVVAERQLAGYGRMKRKWSSPEGGLWFTVLLRPPWHVERAHALTLVASLSVLAVLEGRLGLRCWLKWPNDLFSGRGKICGVLGEVASSGGTCRYCLIGVGVNVNNRPRPVQGARYDMASVRSLLGREVDRTWLLAEILKEMDERYREAKDGGTSSLLSEYVARCRTVGARVRVVLEAGPLEGVAEGVGEDGSLLLRTEDGRRTLYAGDVLHLHMT